MINFVVLSQRFVCFKVDMINIKKNAPIKTFNNKSTVFKMSLDEDSHTDEEKKRNAEIQRLKAAEKFMEIDEGKFECQGCGYIYEPQKGDRFAGIEPGVQFSELPESFNCPACRSNKSQFKSIKKVIAGFADNQKYGLGANSLTGGQKNLVIFGSLTVAFLLFLSGYLLE
nr:rubredoxin [Cryptomonas curvata]|mmetsp:Transcript_37114/g.77595  ORF Transcript_37114/g.77595 Transcript_37114/m.77595 type:complete len:170 (-) Transcript_37114:1024-1533(-)